MKKVFFFLFFLFLNFVLISQKNSECLVKINIIKPLNVSLLQNNLDFGEIILSSQNQVLTKSEQEGAKFLISGHPGKPIFIAFNAAILSNSISVQEYGFDEDQLVFIPSIISSGTNSNFSNTKKINSGDSEILNNDNGIGKIYLWMGGEINVSPANAPGVYLGDFVLTVEY